MRIVLEQWFSFLVFGCLYVSKKPPKNTSCHSLAHRLRDAHLMYWLHEMPLLKWDGLIFPGACLIDPLGRMLVFLVRVIIDMMKHDDQ